MTIRIREVGRGAIGSVRKSCKTPLACAFEATSVIFAGEGPRWWEGFRGGQCEAKMGADSELGRRLVGLGSGWAGETRVTDGIGTPDPNPRTLVNWCL